MSTSNKETKTLIFRNVPVVIFAVALDYEGIPRPKLLAECESEYYRETKIRGWKKGGLDDAVSDYIVRRNAFSEWGEFHEADYCDLEID